ncbi:hypothetical protein BUALT_Bualt04G0046700 [Buddleja alternifolia]|uniref:Uncharacterized protein n=1 Tax=Buddleja alternifolia TaxID=168488 RepID=A0AAV6XMP4_9LAMI|nr:hypothetical protein BUALT_Bualt04G0046700 [Buddleja alternifolia]
MIYKIYNRYKFVFNLQEEGWVACRAFKKRTTGQTKSSSSSNIEGWDSTYYYDHYNEPPAAAAAANSSSTGRHVSSVHHVDQHSIDYITRQPSNLTTMCKQETEPAVVEQSTDQFVQLPQLESPSLPPIKRPAAASILSHATGMINNDYDNDKCIRGSKSNGKNKVTTDWRDLDKFVASQLSHGDGYQGNDVGSSFDSEYSDLGFLLLQNVREEEGPNLNELSTSDADIGISIFNK